MPDLLTRISDTQPASFYRDAASRPQTADLEARTIEVELSTGARGVRQPWLSEAYEEELSMDAAAVRLGRLNNYAPFLDMHSSYRDVGQFVPGSARIESAKLLAKVRFYPAAQLSAQDEMIVQRILSGNRRNLSVGYSVHKWERTRKKDRTDGGEMDLYRAVDWEPYEGSSVTMGFDDSAMTRSLQGESAIPPATPTKGDISMSEKRDTEIQAAEAAKAEAEAMAKREAEAARIAAETERKRIAEIQKRGALLGVEAVDIQRHIDAGTPTQQAVTEMLDAYAERTHKERGTIKNADASIADGGSEAEKRRELIANALAMRISPDRIGDEKNQIKPIPGNPYRQMSLMEIGKELLRSSGASIPGSRDGTARLVLSQRSHSVSDFSAIFADVARNELQREYRIKQPNFAPFCVREDLPDFKTSQVSQLSEFPSLKDVGENGTYEFITASDGKETWQLGKSGWIFPLSWEMIVNDSLGAFTRMPARVQAAALRKQSAIVWSLITANAKMSDGKGCFHADHKNLLGTGSALGAAGLKALRKLLSAQKGLGGVEALELTPRFLLLPTGLYEDWQELISPGYQVTSADENITGENKALIAIGSEHLEAASAISYYLCADPVDIDTIKYGFLLGEDGPVMEERYGFETDGLQIKVRQSFGAAIANHRAFAKNPGASAT